MNREDKGRWSDYWAKRAQRGQGEVVILRVESRLQIACPYEPMFVLLAQSAGARWRHRSKMWSFPEESWLAGLDAIVKCFGLEKLGSDWEHYWITEMAKRESAKPDSILELD